MKYILLMIEIFILLALALISIIPVFLISLILNHLIKTDEPTSSIQPGPSQFN